MTLRDLGIDAWPERVYRTFLDGVATDLDATSERLGLNREETARAVAELLDLGLLYTDPAVACGVSARPPGVALANLLDRREAELLARRHAIDRARAEVARICADHGRGVADAAQAVESIYHPGAVADIIAELTILARRSVSSVHARPWTAAIAGILPGVRTRVVLAASDQLTSLTQLDAAEQHELADTQVRFHPGPIEPMVLVDNRVAVVALDRDESGGALLVHHPSLLRGLAALFDATWAAASSRTATRGATALSTDDRVLLRLLAQGRTDESIAREVAISVRQLRRRITTLMARLGAISRFEAGVLAAGHGWI